MRCYKCSHWDKKGKCCSIFGYLLKHHCYLYKNQPSQTKAKAREGEGGKEMQVSEILEKEGVEFKKFAFRGHCRGRVEGWPEVTDHYNTVANGQLACFLKGSPQVADYVCIWEKYVPGDAYYPASYWAYYVKQQDYPIAFKVLTENGKNPIFYENLLPVDIKKLRRRVEDCLRKSDPETILKIARELGVNMTL